MVTTVVPHPSAGRTLVVRSSAVAATAAGPGKIDAGGTVVAVTINVGAATAVSVIAVSRPIDG